jgi:hypothetical protein
VVIISPALQHSLNTSLHNTNIPLLSILIFTYRDRQENTGGLEVEAEREHEVRLLPLISLLSSFICKNQNNGGGAIYLSSTNLYAGEESVEVARLGQIERYFYIFLFFIYKLLS